MSFDTKFYQLPKGKKMEGRIKKDRVKKYTLGSDRFPLPLSPFCHDTRRLLLKPTQYFSKQNKKIKGP